MRDLPFFATFDTFHRRVQVDGGVPQAGAAIRIQHAFCGFRLDRVGRILSWHEGREYAFSDLSQRGTATAFPHIYRYRIEPQGEGHTIVDVAIRGRWTLKWLPRIATRIWLTAIAEHIAHCIQVGTRWLETGTAVGDSFAHEHEVGSGENAP